MMSQMLSHSYPQGIKQLSPASQRPLSGLPEATQKLSKAFNVFAQRLSKSSGLKQKPTASLSTLVKEAKRLVTTQTK